MLRRGLLEAQGPRGAGTACRPRPALAPRGRPPSVAAHARPKAQQQQQQQQQQEEQQQQQQQRQKAAGPPAASDATAAPPAKRGKLSSWTERMAAIQDLMARVQLQLQSHEQLRGSDAELADRLRAQSEQHLEELMKLAEAEQRQLTGDKRQDKLEELLDSIQHKLDREAQEAALALQDAAAFGPAAQEGAAAAAASTAAPAAAAGQPAAGGSERLRQAVSQASAGLGRRHRRSSAARSQDDAAAAQVARLTQELEAAREQLAAAEAARQEAAQLRQEYDQMCQASFETSRRLSLAQARTLELQAELDRANVELSAASDDLSEHQELQMVYDKQCQDLYRLRMMLQQAQAHSQAVEERAYSSAAKHKQDLHWLMQEHRREVSEANAKQKDLDDELARARMRVLELEQQLWTGISPPPPLPTQQQGDDAELVQQAAQQLTALEQENGELSEEKQQLQRALTELQREQAVLLVELEQLRGAASGGAVGSADAAAGGSARELSLAAELEEAARSRDVLAREVQELRGGLRAAREEAAAARAELLRAKEDSEAAVAAVVAAQEDALAAAAAAGGSEDDAQAQRAAHQLQEVKAEMVQLRGHLAATRRELQLVSGHAGTAEALLKSKEAEYEARLKQLQVWYGKQAVVVAQLRKGVRTPADVGHTTKNRYWVRQELLYNFLKQWVVREAQLEQQPGFLGLQVQPLPGVTPDGGVDVEVTGLWESRPLWEAWSSCSTARKHHLPSGTYQYAPSKGEGAPEDFVPLRAEPGTEGAAGAQ